MQQQICMRATKIDSDEGRRFSDKAFAKYYCLNGIVPKKGIQLTNEMAQKIVATESQVSWSKGRTLSYMMMHSYEIETIMTLIENEPTLVSIKASDFKNSIDTIKALFGENFKQILFRNSEMLGMINREVILAYYNNQLE